ncbi:hypothetical protein DERP_014540 [Dermatophagoides pteronyssinus]|uniref:Uncharacterized protein n=1 Tax=Dermatophagoides pteronyssinus TaxID=6956 RepID=A0ABQ8J1Q3_DERPT|nr:hypothetical protein DERP_014540 [Dermatophagoides pteronyssinus]
MTGRKDKKHYHHMTMSINHIDKILNKKVTYGSFFSGVQDNVQVNRPKDKKQNTLDQVIING